MIHPWRASLLAPGFAGKRQCDLYEVPGSPWCSLLFSLDA